MCLEQPLLIVTCAPSTPETGAGGQDARGPKTGAPMRLCQTRIAHRLGTNTIGVQPIGQLLHDHLGIISPGA